MILGHGDIATALHEGGVDRDGFLFFAAGVSNSGGMREAEYQREFNALNDILNTEARWRHIVYFSSLCIFYSKTRYANHKCEVENFIRDWWADYTIIRMGNITWGNNPHTLINTLRERERLGLPQDIQDVYRYLVDKDEFLHWVRLIPDFSCEMNITGRRMKVADIYREFVIGQREHA